jgi:hypothetical protein
MMSELRCRPKCTSINKNGLSYVQHDDQSWVVCATTLTLSHKRNSICDSCLFSKVSFPLQLPLSSVNNCGSRWEELHLFIHAHIIHTPREWNVLATQLMRNHSVKFLFSMLLSLLLKQSNINQFKTPATTSNKDNKQNHLVLFDSIKNVHAQSTRKLFKFPLYVLFLIYISIKRTKYVEHYSYSTFWHSLRFYIILKYIRTCLNFFQSNLESIMLE